MSREWIMGLQKLYSAYSVFSLFLQDEEGTRAPSPAKSSPPHQTQKNRKIADIHRVCPYKIANSRTQAMGTYINIGNEGFKSKGNMNKPTNNPNSYGLMDNLTLSYDGKRCYFLTYRL